jgi:D-glycero-alpha-D-manno-heptose-7-phosphate kinase
VIRARAPLRLPLGGGGTDLPEYAARFGTHVVAAALDLWVEVSLDEPFTPEAVALKGSALDAVAALLDLPRPTAAFSRCDRPHGTGLGSSGALFVALVLAVAHRAGRALSTEELAHLAFRLERERLGRPVGTQDPYAAAAGGFVSLRAPGGHEALRPALHPLAPSASARAALEARLWLLDTAERRDAGAVLRVQAEELAREAEEATRRMRAIHTLAARVERELGGDDPQLGALFDDHWRAKRGVHANMTSTSIDALYVRGLAAGAAGGKLVGAGGGGTLLFDVPESARATFLSFFQEDGRTLWQVRFSDRGAHVVASPER